MRHSHESSTKTLIVGLIAVGLMLVGWGVAHAQSPVIPSGTGTETDPYQISELGHLVWMGCNSAGSAGKYYSMTADIDASATAGWNDGSIAPVGLWPIGGLEEDTGRDWAFRGVFDGNGHIITGLVINRPDMTCGVGLFGWIREGGQVHNLAVVGGSVSGPYRLGGIVGGNYGIVTNCYASCTVTESLNSRGGYGNDVGGLIGYNLGTVYNCYATGVVCFADAECVGGLVGTNSGTILNCFATGAVKGYYEVGGLVGMNTCLGSNVCGVVRRCYATGSVTGVDGVGGLVGDNPVYETVPVVEDSYWDVQTTGQSTSAGGGTGKNTAAMKQQTTFAGWDFAAVWNIAEGTSYPWLRFSPPPFKLTVNIIGPGSVTIDPISADGTYVSGTVVTLTAKSTGPLDEFIQWSGAQPSDSQSVTVVLDTHRSVTAMFQYGIEINSLADLTKIGQETAYPLSNVHYRLTTDIDASETAAWNDEWTDTTVLEGFMPIGYYANNFNGIFEGNGHTITGLVINRPKTCGDIALFHRVGIRGQVRNLNLVDITVISDRGVGGLIGDNSGTVSNCYVTGTVTGSSAGGLIGGNNGTVFNCYANGRVRGIDGVGGLFGGNGGIVSNCYAVAVVSGDAYVGGFSGSNGGVISNCYAACSVTGRWEVGGLLAGNNGTVSNCFATGAVMGSYKYVGGLVGRNGGEVSKCYAAGAVMGISQVGGLIGYNEIGYSQKGTISDSYWDVQTTTQSKSAGGTGKTTAEMKQQATYLGLDFATDWGISEGISYPWLQYASPPFSLDVDVIGLGVVRIDPPSVDGTYAAGTVVTLTAEVEDGDNKFIEWAGAEAVGSLTARVAMDAHKRVKVTIGPKIAINSLAELARIGNDPEYPLSRVMYILEADIDASETAGWNDSGTDTTVLEGFMPIAGTRTWYGSPPFTGIFEGNGHVISGLVINRPSVANTGLFAEVGGGGYVRNLRIVAGTVTGGCYVGLLAGCNGGIISDCYSEGASQSVYQSVGGLVGWNEGVMLNCAASGIVFGQGPAGGLIGDNRNEVKNCHASSAVQATLGSGGGLIGANDGTASYSSATGAVVGKSGIGGLVGYLGGGGVVSYCYATGKVSGQEKIGGLVGCGYSKYGPGAGPSTISYSYATGAVAGDNYVGGLVGDSGALVNCFAVGTVTGKNNVGGLVGDMHGVVSNSYWDMQTSTQITSDGGTGKTTAQMKQQATFVDWDFATVWGINENESYPYLRGITTDSDGDGVIDQLDACPGTVPAAIVDTQGCTPMIPGDFNRDGDVDGFDISAFMACGSGPEVPYVGDCSWADFDGDIDVDQEDFGVLQRCLSGENIPGDPNCNN